MKRKNAVQPKIDATMKDADRLAIAVKQALEAAQAIRAQAPLFERELLRCVNLQKKVDAAFGGQPFLSDESPTSPKNQQRFKMYFAVMESIAKLKIILIRQLMRVHGVDPNNPHQMWELSTIAAEILAARAPAEVRPRQTSDGQPIPSEPPPERYSQEVLLLARHLHSRAHGVKEAYDADSGAKTSSKTGKTSDRARVH